ncbi:MAG: polymorphic toxin-type HINT domain-containing protein, partial [Planctomycetota bacterium]
ALFMIKGAAKMAALYAAIAFLWDEVVWDLGEAALFDVIAGPFFSSICFEAGTEVLMADGSLRPIEGIAVGRRVRSEPDPLAPPRAGPGDPADPDSYDEIDPATWRRVELRMEDAERGRIRMTLLRPIAWLMLLGAEVGAAVPVQLPELGLVGPAYVTAVEACPPIEEGPPGTAVVTGTFVTERAPLIHLYIDGLDRPIGVTPSHPLYSEDRAAWVGAGSLRAGERVRTTDGLATIDRIETRATPETVYNLEVRGTHTYFISRAKAWVHNACEFPRSRPKFEQKEWITTIVDEAIENGQLKRFARDFVLEALRSAKLSKPVYKELAEYLDWYVYTVLAWAP